QIQTLHLRSRAGIIARTLATLTEILARRRDRNRLRQLDAHLLRDIGLDPLEARRECAKPFWQP
ncbi:MAG: DUF1127 domain-containing protein, partial [Pseudomonadota bacterium]